MSDTGDNDSLTDHNDIDLFNDPSQNIQNDVTDSQFNDEDMFNLIKTEFGQLDRKTFKHDLLQHTDLNDLKPIRTSLFDLVRKRDNTLTDTKLVERTNRDNGQSAGDKMAEDIFVIFQYLEGANNMSELRQCMSRSRRPTTVPDENDGLLTDIFNKLSNKARYTSKGTGNSVVISMLMEVKQMINDGLKPITAKVDKLSCNFENDIKLLKNSLRNKDNEIINLQTQISEYKQRITQLQADVKLKTQELKERDDELDRGKVQKKITDKIASRLDALDNRLKSQTVQKKTLYSDVAAEDQTVEPRNIPVIDTRTSRGSINTDTMDFPTNVHSSSRHNYIDFMTLNNDTNTHSADTDYQQARPIESLISENDMSVFRGVVRRRTFSIVQCNLPIGHMN
ncbi:unnamed protein product [Mytilus coruscus]|uniref:Uncharacterized protein n=1 Tax=Mytilus coruscus TaxID=42192 RepID=A0A6J8C5M8_MYTCO|nr:unnamed protein product [Mytilus coruscus]